MGFSKESTAFFEKLGVYITIPVVFLEPPFTKVAISLPELIRQTNAFSVKRRPGCEAVLKNSKPKELFLEYKVTCHENYSDPSGHDVKVQFDLSQVEKTQDAKRLDVRCSCSCPAFLYWGAQWNLHQRDGLQGPARPLLQAPTERLDLRGNFVICKHCKTVFERILPAIQHNIINIVRKREVEMNKKRLEEAPPTEKGQKLRERQEELRKKKEVDKIVKTKDPEEQKKLIDELVDKETERLEKKKAPTPPNGPPPMAPPAPKPPAPAPKPTPKPPAPKQKVVKRDEPAAAPKPLVPAKPAPKAPTGPTLNDLVRREREKLERRPPKESPKQVWNGKKWVWLPGNAQAKRQRKRTSLESEFLNSITAAGFNWGEIAPPRKRFSPEKIWDGEAWIIPTDDMKFVVEQGGAGGMILTDPMTYRECEEWVRQHPEAGVVNGRFLNVAIVKATPENTSWEPDLTYGDQELLKGLKIK